MILLHCKLPNHFKGTTINNIFLELRCDDRCTTMNVIKFIECLKKKKEQLVGCFRLGFL